MTANFDALGISTTREHHLHGIPIVVGLTEETGDRYGVSILNTKENKLSSLPIIEGRERADAVFDKTVASIYEAVELHYQTKEPRS